MVIQVDIFSYASYITSCFCSYYIGSFVFALYIQDHLLFLCRLCIAYLDATWNLIQLIGRSSFNVSGKSSKNGSSCTFDTFWLSCYLDEL